MTFRPIADEVRPRGNRDDASAKGEILHQFADVLEDHFPAVKVQRDMQKEDLLSVVSGLQVAAEHVLLKNNALRVLGGSLVVIV